MNLLCTNLEINSATQKTEPEPKSLLLQDVMKKVGDLQKRDLRETATKISCLAVLTQKTFITLLKQSLQSVTLLLQIASQERKAGGAYSK